MKKIRRLKRGSAYELLIREMYKIIILNENNKVEKDGLKELDNKIVERTKEILFLLGYDEGEVEGGWEDIGEEE